MWDTIAIIVLLGGLEFVLWHFERRRQMKIEEQDAIQQQQQLDVLDGILTELTIANSIEEPSTGDKIG